MISRRSFLMGTVLSTLFSGFPNFGLYKQPIRSRLTPAQRKIVIENIRKMIRGEINYGNPAIIDGKIKKLERLFQQGEYFRLGIFPSVILSWKRNQ